MRAKMLLFHLRFGNPLFDEDKNTWPGIGPDLGGLKILGSRGLDFSGGRLARNPHYGSNSIRSRLQWRPFDS